MLMESSSVAERQGKALGGRWCESVKDEYLVKWKSGKWQRFGDTAINNLYKNPGKEAGSTWEDE